jgi:hypothetical protein
VYKHTIRAGPRVSPASPWSRATPHPKATNGEKKNYTYTLGKKKNYIHKIKFLLEDKTNIQRAKKKKKKIVINQYTQ